MISDLFKLRKVLFRLIERSCCCSKILAILTTSVATTTTNTHHRDTLKLSARVELYICATWVGVAVCLNNTIAWIALLFLALFVRHENRWQLGL